MSDNSTVDDGQSDCVVIGLDIGGSKTHGVRVAGGAVTGEGFAGGANLTSVGAHEAGRQLDTIFAELGTDNVDVICAGAAGVDTPEAEQTLRQMITARVPHARVQVVHDSHLVLAATGLETGIVLISGTGSVAWGRTADGRQARAGGLGYLLGDEGSGYWIAREAVRHALHRIDHGEPVDRLSEHLAVDCSLQQPIHIVEHFYSQPERRYWAQRAHVVFALAEDGDLVSASIVRAAAAALADIAITVSTRLALDGPVVLAGGILVNQPSLQAQIRRQLSAHGIRDVRVLAADPVRGAIALARAAAQESPDVREIQRSI